MEKLPNEILLKIFSYLEIQDLGRSARVSKKFHEIAYDRESWQKLPINLTWKQVPADLARMSEEVPVTTFNEEELMHEISITDFESDIWEAYQVDQYYAAVDKILDPLERELMWQHVEQDNPSHEEIDPV